MNNKTTGLKSIAYELKISINTVSRALRDCDDISDATKEKVRQKAYELGYIPNNVSQFIKKNNRPLVAVVLNNFNNFFFQIICQKLSEAFEKDKFEFTIVYTIKKKLDLEIIRQCISQRADGIITLIEVEDDAVASAKLNNMPMVALGRNVEKDYVDQVYENDQQGGKLVAEYLSLFNFNKYVYIKMSNIECSRRRQKSFIQRLNEINPDYKIEVVEVAHLSSKLPKLVKQGYKGIFCFNDDIVYELMKTLEKSIPNYKEKYNDVKIVGFDCLSTKTNGLIDIDSIDYDYDSICQYAVTLLKERFNGRKEKKTIKVSVSMHKGSN